MYPYLSRGDRLPTVAALQLLLNETLGEGYVTIDGHFRGRTEDGVKTIQGSFRARPDGRVDGRTWAELVKGHDLKVIDAVDVTTPDYVWHHETPDGNGFTSEDQLEIVVDSRTGRKIKSRGKRLELEIAEEVKNITDVGGTPIVTGGMCNGVDHVVGRVLHRVADHGRIVLLRFHGHGAPGLMGISSGTGTYLECRKCSWGGYWVEGLRWCPKCGFPARKMKESSWKAKDRSDIVPPTRKYDAVYRELVKALRPLRGAFGPFSSVELHGCEVGGRKPKKRRKKKPVPVRLLQRLSNLWGVPVSAGRRTQYSGRDEDLQDRRAGHRTFRFEGPVVTACPGALRLREWATSLRGLGIPHH